MLFNSVMSTIFLHVGQCGIQLGQSFWEEAASWSRPRVHSNPTTTRTPKSTTRQGAGAANQTHTPSSRQATSNREVKAKIDEGCLPFSLPDGKVPCILVDSEAKVVQNSITRCTVLGRRVPKDCVFTDKTGRGNNWAYGYYGRKEMASSDSFQPQNLKESVKECVRKVIERCDRFTGTVLFHSLAGGTGSGLGSALIEQLRDDYPMAYILSVLVAPFSYGETPLQHYNTLLCLSRLQDHCDSTLVFRNDSVLDQVQRQAAMSGVAGGRTKDGGCFTEGNSIEDMNRHISLSLCNSFLPLWSPKPSKGCFEVWEMVRSLCPDPSTKFITPGHAHSLKPTTTWDQLISSHLRTKSKSQGKSLTSSMIFIARGNPSNVDSLVRNSRSIEHKLKQTYNTVDWNPYPVDFWFSHEQRLGERKLATVLANSSLVGEYIDGVQQRANVMFQERAYLHWYKRFGCEDETFIEAFESVQRIVNNYSSM